MNIEYQSSIIQAQRISYILLEILKPQSDGNSWKIKYFRAIQYEDQNYIEVVFISYKDDRFLIYTVNYDGSNYYNTISF